MLLVHEDGAGTEVMRVYPFYESNQLKKDKYIKQHL